MYILLEHYKLYLKQGLIEPSIVKQATNQYHEDSDQVGTFCKEFIQKSNNKKAYLKFADIKIKFKESDYNLMIKDKDLKSLITKSLGIEWTKRIKIDNENIYSVYKGIEWIPKEEEEEEEE